MKNIKFLLALAFAFSAYVAVAQDFDDPKYAKWGATAEERKQNMLNSSFLKESCDNRNFEQAAHYLKDLITKCPEATQSIYQRGVIVFKNRINRAKSVEEKEGYVDSLLLIYDLRNRYFGDGGGLASGKILDMKAREMLTYKPGDRAGIRKAFQEVIAINGEKTDPETMVAYFSNLCDDYKNTDQLTPEEVIAEYDRLTPFFAANPTAAEYRKQFDAAFAMSNVASCENLEKLFRARLAENPDDEATLSQAVGLMSRARCESDYYFSIAEKYYQLKPSSEIALFLAQAFQAKNDFPKASKYINEALSTEKNPTERGKLLVRLALIQLVSNDISSAASTARQARDLNPQDGVPYFLLAQCYATSAGQCGGFSGQATMWAAYDTMSQAINLLPADSEYLSSAKTSQSAYRSRFPSSEEIFFNEMKEGARYTVTCGTASGIVTTVRAR